MIVKIGTYPQTHVGDPELIKKLDGITQKDENGYVLCDGDHYLKEYVEQMDELYEFIAKHNPCYSDGKPIKTGVYEWFKVEPVEFRAIQPVLGMRGQYLVSDKVLDGRIFQEYNENYVSESVYNSFDLLGWLNDVPYKRFAAGDENLKKSLENQTLRNRNFKLMIPRAKPSQIEKRRHLMTDYARIHCGWFDMDNDCGQIWTTAFDHNPGNDRPIQTVGTAGETCMAAPDFPLGVVFKISMPVSMEEMISDLPEKIVLLDYNCTHEIGSFCACRAEQYVLLGNKLVKNVHCDLFNESLIDPDDLGDDEIITPDEGFGASYDNTITVDDTDMDDAMDELIKLYDSHKETEDEEDYDEDDSDEEDYDEDDSDEEEYDEDDCDEEDYDEDSDVTYSLAVLDKEEYAELMMDAEDAPDVFMGAGLERFSEEELAPYFDRFQEICGGFSVRMDDDDDDGDYDLDDLQVDFF